MKEYEMMYLIKPNLDNEKYEELEQKVQGWIEKGKGKVVYSEKWGMRALATKLKKFDKAFYVITRFEGLNETLEYVNKQIRISENIFRYLIIDSKSLPKIAKSKEA